MTTSTQIQNVTADRLPLDAKAPHPLETATFSLGCFWSPDAQFGVIPGVIRTRVGYTGGNQKNPTYHNLGNHIETVEIDYDPAQISYPDLLATFWQSHSPTDEPWSRQYMSAIFYHNDSQKQQAEATRDRHAAQAGTIYTEIQPISTFYLAEDYHQKYNLRRHPELTKELESVYNSVEFTNSTVAARLNGYVSGYGDGDRFHAELPEFGLSEPAQKTLQKIVQSRLRSRQQ